jgi:hypothetical protein
MICRPFVFAIAATALLSASAQAQTESRPDLVTDRPDFTESSEVVGHGLFQFEAGVNYEGDSAARSLTVPGALLRLGFGPRLELRLATDGFLSQRVGGLRVSGAGDAEIGAKIRLFDQAAAGVDIAIIPAVSLPTGSDSQSSGGVDPSFKLTWARSMPGDFGLTGNLNVASLTESETRFVQRAVSVSLGRALVAGWGGFLEAYAFSPMERGLGAGATVDGGITRPLGANLQFDVEAGRGVTADAPDWFVGFGFAVRGRAAGIR